MSLIKKTMWCFFVIGWQILCCYMTLPLWRFTETQLKHYFPSFQQKSRGRQQYIVKNVAKSLVLCFLTPPSLWIINRIVFNGTWEDALIKCMGAIYCGGDIIALLTMWSKIPFTTKLHHSCVLVFSIMNAVYIDYLDPSNIWRHTATLAAFSTPTYCVNTYLGIRCLDDISDKEKKRFADFALTGYTFCILLSFTWQMFVVYQHIWSWDVYLYLAALFTIYYDDYHLSTYLLDNSNLSKIF